MVCNACHNNIGCRTTVCPLCGASLVHSEADARAINALPRRYPKRGNVPFFSTSRFDKVYLLVALCLVLSSLTTELVVTKKATYFPIGVAGVFYLYFFIRATVYGTAYFSQKVVAQALFLTLIAFLISFLVPAPLVIFEYVLPTIYLLSMLMVGIYTLVHFRRVRLHLLNLLSSAVLSCLPFVGLLSPLGEMNIVFATVTAGLGAAVFLLTLLFAHKPLMRELKRVFHL